MYEPFIDYFTSLSPSDGTVDFYFRINTLNNSSGIYLDYGAGRAGWFEDDPIESRRTLRCMLGKFAEVIAVDIDPVVTKNKSVDRTIMINGNHIPLDDESVDVIVADYVIEHIHSPKAFADEISRLLKPGGWFCARTPHKAHYVAIAERLMPKFLENYVLQSAQPGRKAVDVFPKTYKMNTLRDITLAFPGWNNQSFCRRSDPAYYFGSRPIFNIADFLHRAMPAPFSGNLFVFLQKPSNSTESH